MGGWICTKLINIFEIACVFFTQKRTEILTWVYCALYTVQDIECILSFFRGWKWFYGSTRVRTRTRTSTRKLPFFFLIFRWMRLEGVWGVHRHVRMMTMCMGGYNNDGVPPFLPLVVGSPPRHLIMRPNFLSLSVSLSLFIFDRQLSSCHQLHLIDVLAGGMKLLLSSCNGTKL